MGAESTSAIDIPEEQIKLILDQAHTRGTAGLDRFLSILDDPYVVARYHIMAREGRLDASIFKLLLAYKHGEPPKKIELTGKDGGPVQMVRRVIIDPKTEVLESEYRQTEGG